MTCPQGCSKVSESLTNNVYAARNPHLRHTSSAAIIARVVAVVAGVNSSLTSAGINSSSSRRCCRGTRDSVLVRCGLRDKQRTHGRRGCENDANERRRLHPVRAPRDITAAAGADGADECKAYHQHCEAERAGQRQLLPPADANAPDDADGKGDDF